MPFINGVHIRCEVAQVETIKQVSLYVTFKGKVCQCHILFKTVTSSDRRLATLLATPKQRMWPQCSASYQKHSQQTSDLLGITVIQMSLTPIWFLLNISETYVVLGFSLATLPRIFLPQKTMPMEANGQTGLS